MQGWIKPASACLNVFLIDVVVIAATTVSHAIKRYARIPKFIVCFDMCFIMRPYELALGRVIMMTQAVGTLFLAQVYWVTYK